MFNVSDSQNLNNLPLASEKDAKKAEQTNKQTNKQRKFSIFDINPQDDIVSKSEQTASLTVDSKIGNEFKNNIFSRFQEIVTKNMTTDAEIDQIDEGINQQLTTAKEDIQTELKRIEEEARKAVEEEEQAKTEKYNKDGKTIKDSTEIIVQNGEKIEEIAQKFNCTVEEIKALNSDQIKTSKKGVEYFLVGAKIKVPGKIDNDDDRIKDRKSSEEAEAEWTEGYEQKKAEVAAKKAAYLASPEYQAKLKQEAQYKELGLINYNDAGKETTGYKKAKDNESFKKATDKRTFTTKDGKRSENFVGEKYTIIGKARDGRTIARDNKGKVVVIAHNGLVLKEQYVKDDVTFDKAKAKGKTIKNNKGQEFAVVEDRNDGHGRMVVVDSHGQRQILSGGQSKTDLKDRVFLNKGYVEASDKVDKGEGLKTKTGAEGIKYAKDAQGRVWYFDTKRKGAQGISGQERKNLIQKEAQYITDKFVKAAAIWGYTDDDLLKEAYEDIYSKEILANVNNELMQRDSSYIPKEGSPYNAVETLIEDEEGHDTLRKAVSKLASSGAYGTKAETDEKITNIVKHELQYEVHGGVFGITRYEDLNKIMAMVSNREQRIALEAKVKNDKSFNANGVMDYIRKDDRGFDWSESDLAMLESNWVKNGAYAGGIDQKDRNRIRTTLFNANEEDAHLRAFNITQTSEDIKHLNGLCEKENEEKGYEKQFKGQDAIQQNIAGRTNLDIEKIDTYNRQMHEDGEPADLIAQRALYNARQGNFTEIFNDRDSEAYTILEGMIKNGEIKGCKSLQDLYNQAYKNTGNKEDKAHIKANAIINGIVHVKDDELMDLCVELLHSADENKGLGASTAISAEHTNKADEQLNQFKAIIQQQGPEFTKKLEKRLQNEKFEYSYSITRVGGGSSSTQTYTVNNKGNYLDIVKNSYQIQAGEGKFYDKNNKLITDPELISEIKNRNKETLKEMRSMVAQLKQIYKTGVDKEGWSSNLANDVVTYGGFGTDRGDVANIYFEAENLLKQMEAAAEGKLTDAGGKTVSLQDLVKKQKNILETKLQDANNSYTQSIMYTKMAGVMAITIAATGGIAVGASAIAGSSVGVALGLSTAAAEGTALTATGSAAVLAATAAGTGLVEYGLEYSEMVTSNEGFDRARNSEIALQATIDGGSVIAGGMLAKGAAIIVKNANPIIQSVGKLTICAAGDAAVGAIGEYVVSGEVTIEGVACNAIFSAAGNLVEYWPKKGGKTTNLNTTKSFDDILNNSQLGKTTGGDANHKIDRLGNRKFEEMSKELDELCKNATPEQLQQLEKRVKRFSSDTQRDAFMEKINKRKAELNAQEKVNIEHKEEKKSGEIEFTPVTSAKEAESMYDQLITSRSEFRKELANGKKVKFNQTDEGWLQATYYENGNIVRKPMGTRWEIHLYANSPEEWANVAKLSIPYLEENQIVYKTITGFDQFKWLENCTGPDIPQGSQKGKAFTIYFKNEDEFLKVASALESKFEASGLKSSGKVVNEGQIGDSGFISYRNESGERGTKYKPDDMEDPYLKMKETQSKENASIDKQTNNEANKPIESTQNEVHPKDNVKLKEKLGNLYATFVKIYDAIPNIKTIGDYNKISNFIVEKFSLPHLKEEYNQLMTRLNNVAKTLHLDVFSSKKEIQQPEHYTIDLKQGNVELKQDAKLVLGNSEVLDMANLPDNIKQKINNLKNGETVTIGRNDINPDNDFLSQNHLNITKRDGKIYASDISTNGAKMMDAANYEAYTSLINRENQGTFIHKNYNNIKESLLEITGGDYTVLNTLVKALDSHSINPRQFTDIARHTNRNNLAILDAYGKGKLKNGASNVSSQDLLYLMMFNRNNNNVNTLITNPQKVNEFINNTNKTIQELNSKTFTFINPKNGKTEVVKPNKDFIDTLITGSFTYEGHRVDGHLNTGVLDDMEALIHGKSYIPEFRAFSNLNDVFKKTNTGDAVSVGNKMYVNDGTSMVKLNYSRETYEKLFPPIERFNITQGTLGDCYLVTTIDALMDTPHGRADIYKMFSEQNGDIHVTIASSLGESYVHEHFDSKGRHSMHENGFAMLEQAYAKFEHRNANLKAVANARVGQTVINSNIDGGWMDDAVKGLIGYDHQATRVYDRSQKSVQIFNNMINAYANKENHILQFATRLEKNHDNPLDPRYNIQYSHAYTIKGYDKTTDMVSISNPWHAGITIEIPRTDLLKYMDAMSDCMI